MNSVVENIDCMIGMARYPDKYFELAIVDPPYGLGDVNFMSNRPKMIHKNKDWNKVIPTEDYFNELHRVSKHQIIWGCNYYAKFIPAVGRIVHDKLIPKHGLQTFSDCDLASCSMFNRIVKFTYGWRGNVQNGKMNLTNGGPDGRIHPTQKPISLYKYCLRYAKPGWKILDTHLGSGSSRIAAHGLGFDFTGFEIDKDYFEAQEKRFNDYKKQLVLF